LAGTLSQVPRAGLQTSAVHGFASWAHVTARGPHVQAPLLTTPSLTVQAL
jgi:hypothetical protein